VVVPKLSLPPNHRNHFQIASDLKVFVEHLSELADSHSMTSRQRKLAHDRCVFRLKDIPRHLSAVDWIGPITNNNFLRQPARCSHAIRKCVNERIDSTTD